MLELGPTTAATTRSTPSVPARATAARAALATSRSRMFRCHGASVLRSRPTMRKTMSAPQDLALFSERTHLSEQPTQLLTLVRGQAVAPALVDVDLTHPVTQRLRRNT